MCPFFSLLSEQDPFEEDKEPSSCATRTVPQSDYLNPDNNNLVEVKAKVVLYPSFSVFRMSRFVLKTSTSFHLLQATKGEKYFERSHQTYRLLRRKNLIVEAVRNFKVIEGLFQSVDNVTHKHFIIIFHESTEWKTRFLFLQAAEDDQ